MASVGKNSPAEKAGIKAGDIILEFDGKKINTMKKLPNVVASTEVGKSVELKIWRNKKLISKRLILGRLETSEEFKETIPLDNVNKLVSSRNINANKNSFQAIIKTYNATLTIAGLDKGIAIFRII